MVRDRDKRLAQLAQMSSSNGERKSRTDIIGSFENIHVEKHGMCGAGTTNFAKWDIDLTVKGTGPGGQETGITVTDLA